MQPAPKVQFDLEGFKAFAAQQTGEYDYEDIELCAIGQYITHLLGPCHSRYFMRVDPHGIVYLRSLTDVDPSYEVRYPVGIDRIVQNAFEQTDYDAKVWTWEQLNYALSQEVEA